MKLYFAPLEGITTYVYRNTHAQLFGGCDGYFAPFINPSDNERISNKSIKDILPENNSVADLRVQVLTSNIGSFVRFADKLKAIGYSRVNLNFGCPSATVTNKGRGSGFLRDVTAVDEFLQGASHCGLELSVKTRAGYWDTKELDALMEVYNKYKLTELIIHPRSREQFYGGTPDYAAFERACATSANPVCYNGNVFHVSGYNAIVRRFEGLDGVMLGRGAVANPALFRQIRGGARLTTAELVEFAHLLADNYNAVLKSDANTMYKLKEIWMLVMWNFQDNKKMIKAIKKATRLSDLLAVADNMPELE